MIKRFFGHIGRFSAMLGKVLSKPHKYRIFVRQLFNEIDQLGLNSIWLVIIISVFIGGIMTIQFSYALANPLYPKNLIGFGTRDTLILEFSSTMLALIMAGKMGSHITSEIGSMRVAEQIDSLEVMGINSANFLILPKIVAVVFIFPFLYITSVFWGIIGGVLISMTGDFVTITDFISGLRIFFVPYYITFSLIKSVVFGFLVATIPAYFGYYVKGGALDVGKANTTSVVSTSVAILFFDLVLTQLLLSA